MKVFLCLILAHLLADFVFQRDELVKKKMGYFQTSQHFFTIKNPLFEHGLIVFLLMLPLLIQLGPWYQVVILSLFISVGHISIDYLKLMILPKKITGKAYLFFYRSRSSSTIYLYSK